MLKELDHPFSRGENVYDVTFENVQAGLRTDYLFRLANQRGGIVLGTGDLSELALGWSTYGVGDQMSHYNVNGGVPKTLIQHLIRWVIASHQFDDAVNEVLQSVLDTEITPELVPTGEDEQIQSSEATVGPYVLQDFSLFQVLRYGFRPSKVAFLAWHAWSDPERGRMARGVPRTRATGVLAQGDPALAAGVRAAVLLVRPIQTIGDAERAQGVTRRVALAARRLAGAVGHVGAHLARRDRTRDPRGLNASVVGLPAAGLQRAHRADQRTQQHPDGGPPPLTGRRRDTGADGKADDQRQVQPAVAPGAVRVIGCHRAAQRSYVPVNAPRATT